MLLRFREKSKSNLSLYYPFILVSFFSIRTSVSCSQRTAAWRAGGGTLKLPFGFPPYDSEKLMQAWLFARSAASVKPCGLFLLVARHSSNKFGSALAYCVGSDGRQTFKFPQNFPRADTPTDANRACEFNEVKPLVGGWFICLFTHQSFFCFFLFFSKS